MNVGFLSRKQLTGPIVVGVLTVFGGIGEAFGGAPPARPLAENFFGQTCMNDTDCLNTSHCVPNPNGGFPGTCYVPKNRYLSIVANPTNNGTLTARRVSFTLPGGVTSQVVGWVGPPVEKVSGMFPPVGFPFTEPNAFVSFLQSSPHFMDWNTVGGTVHLTGCGIRPGFASKFCTGDNATPCSGNDGCAGNGTCSALGMLYGVQSIPQGANVADEASYSVPLELRTVGQWGDVAGGLFIAGQLSPPENHTGIADVFALLGLFTTTNESLSIIWADLTPVIPDQFIGMVDIFGAVNGFTSAGVDYPFTPDPCACLGGCPPLGS